MDSDKNKCLLCDKMEAVHLHEIFFGSSNRQTSIEYNLRAPLCCDHHLNVVHKEKKKYQRIICDMIGIDYDRINIIMNKVKKTWSLSEKTFMESTREYMDSWYMIRQKYLERVI